MTTKIILIQLPIPQINYGVKTGNIPLAAACIKQANTGNPSLKIDILSERISSYMGDAALVSHLRRLQPDVIGFSIFNWNVDRSLHIARQLKAHCNSRIVFGGPEATPDNQRISDDTVDAIVHGPGETGLSQALGIIDTQRSAADSGNADTIFASSPSPYLNGLLEPEIDDMVYLESQRGCPYRCGFCYYRKSRRGVVSAADSIVLDTIGWTLEQGISELCFLDPSLNSRPELKTLLRRIAAENHHGRLSLNGEIRAESVDNELADLFAAAGFTYFEIGLQSITPRAVKLMQRSIDLDRFVEGIHLLKQRDILPRIDLIVGLPGDTPNDFERTLQFVTDNDLHDDVQVFPLSVLPGTDFRRQAGKWGLVFQNDPPYMIIQTPAFKHDDMLAAFDRAEEVLDVALFPDPHLNISLRQTGKDPIGNDHHTVKISGTKAVNRLMLRPELGLTEVGALAETLTHPYQLVILPSITDPAYIPRVVEITTTANPFTPFEMVFLEPDILPDIRPLLAATRLKRPHYLDNDLRLYYDTPGNRSVLFTLVTTTPYRCFSGDMQRQVFWWKADYLPTADELDTFHSIGGLLADTRLPSAAVEAWQDRLAPKADDLPLITFADTGHQDRWRMLTLGDEVCSYQST
jgi:radical SAM superfamily enzyme YgiQ (UPF0313 family)